MVFLRFFRPSVHLLVPAAMLLVGLALTELVVWQEQDRLLSDQHEQTMATAATVRAELEAELNATLHLASGLAAYIRATEGKPDRRELHSMLEGLYRRGHHLRNMGIAPDNRVSAIYPVAGNEKVLGLHYPSLPEQWPTISRAIASHQPTLSGPLALVQGGQGLIYRMPVYLADGRYWGLISTVIDADQLLRLTVTAQEKANLHLALRGRDGLGAKGAVFYGPATLFADKSAVTMNIAVSGGEWQLALGQADKKSPMARLLAIRLAGSGISLLLALLLGRSLKAYRQQRLLTARLRTEHEKLHGLYELSPLGIALLDEEGRYLEVNRSFCRITGYDEEELRHLDYRRLTPEDNAAQEEKLMATLMRQGRYGPAEKAYLRKDGTRISVQISAALVPGEGGERYIGAIVEDISERKAAEARIHLLAFYDPLTTLPNRRLLMDRLGHALAASQRHRQYGALLFIDLDNFKTLNDTRGHDVGDCLLQSVADRLSKSVRERDTVARLGGDEFVIMLEELSGEISVAAAQSEAIAEKIRDQLDRPYLLEGDATSFHCSASFGVSLFCGQRETVDTLLKQADVALYQAKAAGRNAIRFYNSEMQATLDVRAKMEHDLRRALVNNEFELYFQPQIGAATGLTGAEALLRWKPRGGATVSPAEFIPLAEETGMILPIGLWVLDQACRQLAHWQTMPATARLQLAINVSAQQFRQQEFVQQVRQALTKHGVRPSGLKIELTESLVLDDVEDAIDKMQALRRLGVTFSLDDFGTGYSSLSYLRRLPIDQVKIDRSFVTDIAEAGNDLDNSAIIRAIISMSESLHLQVIAEGVETESQQDFLIRHGCDHFQGYLFGRPMPGDSFATILN
ncbi:hypothetical protein DLREEDagrD3_07200 [Denitratisoma sp. agr-D3]